MARVEDHGRGRHGERGFTLAMFVMVVAIVSIMMGVAVQSVEFSMRREREAELIFRGQQYIEAIRLYKTKYGRYPMRMKEIWEAKPRVVRQKWKDPITDSEAWGLIFVGQDRVTGLRGGAGGVQLAPTAGIGGAFGDDSETTIGDGGDRRAGRPGEGERLPPGVQRGAEGELIGPIMGVRSTSCDESIKIFEGRTSYCEWQFVYREDERLQRGGGGRPGGGGIHGGNYPTPIPGGGGTGGGTGGSGGGDPGDGGGGPDYGVTPTR